MTIAVDFDGTIVGHAYPAIGREIPGAIATLLRLQAQGHRLILWTVREGELLDRAVEYCRERGLEFYAANEHYTDEPKTSGDPEQKSCRKLTADIYIDDRNIGGFPGWEAIYEMISEHITYAGYYSRLSSPRRDRRSLLQRIFKSH